MNTGNTYVRNSKSKTQVKILSCERKVTQMEDLEIKVNDWLSIHPEITVVDIKLLSHREIPSVLIVYKEDVNHEEIRKIVDSIEERYNE